MKRIIFALLGVLALLSSAGSCGGQGGKPKPLTPIQKIMADCGPGCTPIGYDIYLTDEHGVPVPLSDGTVAELTITAMQLDSNGKPVPSPIHDVDTGTIVDSPYGPRPHEVPIVNLNVLPPNTISSVADIEIPNLNAGWTVYCETHVYSDGGDIIVSRDQKNNPSPLGPGMGLQLDAHIECGWPGIPQP